MEYSKRVHLLLPALVVDSLKERAQKENTSMAWLATEALCQYLDISSEELVSKRGKALPKTFAERGKSVDWKLKANKRRCRKCGTTKWSAEDLQPRTGECPECRGLVRKE